MFVSGFCAGSASTYAGSSTRSTSDMFRLAAAPAAGAADALLATSDGRGGQFSALSFNKFLAGVANNGTIPNYAPRGTWERDQLTCGSKGNVYSMKLFAAAVALQSTSDGRGKAGKCPHSGDSTVHGCSYFGHRKMGIGH